MLNARYFIAYALVTFSDGEVSEPFVMCVGNIVCMCTCACECECVCLRLTQAHEH